LNNYFNLKKYFKESRAAFTGEYRLYGVSTPKGISLISTKAIHDFIDLDRFAILYDSIKEIIPSMRLEIGNCKV
jgi:hypothetical protein